MKKITFIGAGSMGFTRNLVSDILTFDAFKDVTISLMDIHEGRLGYSRRAVEKIIKARNCPDARVEVTADRAKALEGADGVVCTILSGGVRVWRHDVEIPKAYGVDINVGDTRGPAGIFRFLRTAPVMLDICGDIAKYCPKAVFLNYTNPMAMLCRIMQGEYPALSVTGLCHSVQGTAQMLAGWLGENIRDVTYTCAAINHQAFYTEYKVRGEDAYPRLREVIDKPEIYNEEIVRNEIFKAFGYYVTESSGHNSEYCAWFRKRPDLIEKYCTHGTGWNPGLHAYILGEYLRGEDTWQTEFEDWIQNGEVNKLWNGEYAAYIFNGIFGNGDPFRFNGNVRNFGIVDNLPHGACVEVPCLADPAGFTPFRVGAMPRQCAALCSLSSELEELAVEGALTGDPVKVYQAVMMDPLTSAVLSLAEIREMVRAMFEKNGDYLGHFAKL
ncbi:MAG: alpha-galactosidase [Oscillospiraceae bacterium]|jgi:alpha-galactosidase|nr:alpha-galactosidase [Oscillospiraceae bacterium]